MYNDLREIYLWKVSNTDMTKFVVKCLIFQQVKVKNQKPDVLLQEIQIPNLKWEDIIMDFVVSLPRTQKSYDFIWAIVDRLNKFAHFIPIGSTYSAEDYSRIIIDDIVCLHGILLSIT